MTKVWAQQLVKDVQKYTAIEQELRPRYEKEFGGASVGDDINF